jgi:L-asparagine oxygenase
MVIVTNHIALNAYEADEIEELAQDLATSPSSQPEEFCKEARRASWNLPKRLAKRLDHFSRWGSPTGILLISELPVGEVPTTPPDNSRHLGETTILARIQAMCNEFLGHMVAYEAEGAGHLFQDMVPSKQSAHTQTSLSSAVELEVHTEQAFSDLRPDFLSLACIRGDASAHTYLLRARDVVANVGAGASSMLRQPLWTTGVDASFRVDEHEFIHGDVRGPMPIISGSAEDPFMILDQDLMRGTTSDAQLLLDRVSNLYVRCREAYTLEPGQILILDNNRVAHGRSNYIARFDGTDRFIIRSFVVRDLAKSRHARDGDSRVIAGRFS